jgi:hypothetical protein
MKETYYFKHDYNATQDPKIMMLLSKAGLNGVAMYWILIEILHQQNDSLISFESYLGFINFYCAFDRTKAGGEEMIAKALIEVGLFKKEGDFIVSKRVLANKLDRDLMREKRSFAGKKSAEAKQKSTSVEHVLNTCQLKKEKKRKEKKRKVNECYAENSASPSQTSKLFFDDLAEQERVVIGLVAKGYEEQATRNEIAKFISYWTEPNKSGSKQLWEMKVTFEVGRRLATWFQRANSFGGSNKSRVTII